MKSVFNKNFHSVFYRQEHLRSHSLFQNKSAQFFKRECATSPQVETVARDSIKQLRTYNLDAEYDKLFEGYSQILANNTFELTSKMFDPLLDACRTLHDTELAKEVVAHMRSRNLVPTEQGCAACIEAIIPSGGAYAALQFYNEIKNDVDFKTDKVYAALLKGLEYKRDFKTASQIYHEMLKKNIPITTKDYFQPLLNLMGPPIPYEEFEKLHNRSISLFGAYSGTFVTLTKTLLKYQKYDQAFQVAVDFEKENHPNIDKESTLVQILTTIMNHYLVIQDYTSMQKVVDYYLKLRLPLRPSLFNILLRRGDQEVDAPSNALKIIEKMRKSNIAPNRLTFRIATRMVYGDLESGLKLLNLAKSMGKIPHVDQYISLIKICDYHTMLFIISDMEELRVVMNPALAYAIFRKYAIYFPNRDISDPLPVELDRIVKNCLKDFQLESLLCIYATLGDQERVGEILDKMQEVDYKPHPKTLETLIHSEVLGSKSIAVQSFKMFKSLGVTPPITAYTSLLEQVERDLNEAWIVYEDLKKNYGTPPAPVFIKMFEIAEFCESHRTVLHLLKEAEACTSTTLPLLQKLMRVAMNVDQPEKCYKYLEQVRLKGGLAGVPLLKRIIKTLVNKGEREMAANIAESHKAEFTKDEFQDVLDTLK